MEVRKRKHRKMKTAAEIKQEIRALQVELEQKEQEEQLKIGQKLQELTGLETWAEIEPVLRRMSSKPETEQVTANLS